MYNGNELRIIQSLQKDIEDELNRIGLLYRLDSMALVGRYHL